jgi:hypothetical protein
MTGSCEDFAAKRRSAQRFASAYNFGKESGVAFEQRQAEQRPRMRSRSSLRA